MIYSIVKTQTHPEEPYEFFPAYDEQHTKDLIRTLVESDFYSVEWRRITNRFLQYEEAIEKCYIGTQEEQRFLQQYYDRQDKQ